MDKYNLSFSFATSINSQKEYISNNDSNISYNLPSDRKSSNIYTLAKAFLLISSMTNKKLQKLCYYAKGWYLALYDTNLISEQFQAWVHGAVQPALYQKYKEYGFSEIPKLLENSGIPEEFISFAQEIYSSYGHLTGDELERLNHQEEPWLNARKDCQPWENSTTIISEDDMKIYFRKMM